MSKGPDLPRLVNFSDSDMSTDSDSEDVGKILSCSEMVPSLNDHNPYMMNSYVPCALETPENVVDPIDEPTPPKIENNKKKEEDSGSRLSSSKLSDKLGLSKYDDVGSSREKRSSSRGRQSKPWGRRSHSKSRRSSSRPRSGSRGRSSSRGRRSESRGRRSVSRGRRSGSRGRRSVSKDRSRSRGRRSGSRGKRSGSRGRRSGSRSRRSRSRSRDLRKRSRSGSRGRYRRSRSRSRGRHRRSRSGSRRRRDRRYGSPRRSRRLSPPRAFRTLDTLEKLGIELKPAPPPEDPQPVIPPYYNRLAVNPSKYAQQIAKRKLLWGGKTSEEGTAKASTWEGATFSQDQDGKMSAKFKRLMGIKEDGTSTSKDNQGQSIIKRQQELFSSMEIQYEAARQATHTQRGVGLGFSTHPHHYPS